MKCFLYDEEKHGNINLDEFFKDKLNQSNYKLKKIYENDISYIYKYIVKIDDENNILAVLPFILYKNKLANIINSLPFIAYGGITCGEYNKKELFNELLCFLDNFAKDNNVLLITLCTQPFKQNDYELYKEIFKPDYERKNFYQYIDLKKDIFEEMKAKFKGNLKRNIKKCKEKYNVQVKESYDLNDLRYWYDKVYVKRLTETHCAIYPYKVFEAFITEINKYKIKMLYGLRDGKIIAGGLYLNQGICVDNFMRVVDTESLHTQVGTYLDYLSIQYAIKNKVEFYNWQSCDEIGSSIFKYKEDWGSDIGYHYYLTKVTGDITELKNTPLSIVKKEFKGIYVMPYEELNK